MEEVEFEFYLDAWLYCRANNIPMTKVHKVSFKMWKVVY